MVDWNDLRYFVALARQGSTRSAARSLNVSQTTVSRRLAALEQGLDVALFERLSSGYVLTDLGRQLLQHAEHARAGADALVAAAAASKREVRGTVRITVDDVYAVTVLAPAIRDFRDAYRHIRIELDTTGEIRDLAAGEADIAIRSCITPDDPNLVGRRLFPDNFSFYCSTDYAAAHGVPGCTGELADHALIAGGGGGIERDYDNWLARKGLESAIVMRSSSATGLLSAVKSGAGIAALPCVVASREPDLIRCYPPPNDNPSFLWLLTHERLRDTPRVRAVMDFLYARLKPLRPSTEHGQRGG